MSQFDVRRITYFHAPGAHNTENVVRLVKERTDEGDIKRVVVASVTGQTALRVAEELKGRSITVVCVSGPPSWGIYHGIEHPFVKGDLRERLEKLGVNVVDKTPSTLSGDTVDYSLARYGYMPASWVVAETLEAVGGYGLKTAVEAIVMATDSAAVPPYMDVISVAGSDRGADTAIVARTAYSYSVFSRDSDKRFQVMEIIAMPRAKKWYKSVTIAEHVVREIDKGETLEPTSESKWTLNFER